MVMISALLGGLGSGIMGALLTCGIIFFGWSALADRPFIQAPADWLGMVVFFINCVMISSVAEAMRRAQARAQQARKDAEEANRAKSVFLANMSHELRTPLNAVLGFSQLIRNAPDIPEEHLAGLDVITNSGEHLLNLINNILDISKIESGRILLEETDTDLYHVLHDVQSLMLVTALEKKLTFQVEQAPDLPRYVRIDAGRLRQVLLNLIGNAIKHTDSGEVILRAMPTATEVDGQLRLRFEVKDSGPGIRPNDRERIFEAFVQVGDNTAGTGLGLTISKQNVELMGGTIGVGGEYGNGACFFFEIPARAVAGGAMPAATQRRRILGLVEGQPRVRLLIAEDHPQNRLLLRKLLTPLGVEIREAVNGLEALRTCAQWQPDLIWMDIRMPVMDGLEATKRIKSEIAERPPKIVALTAHALEEERVEILAAGCDDVIRKPYRDTEIFDALAKHLGLRFLYADDDKPVAAVYPPLNAAALASLAPDLLQELAQAVELLDEQRCIDVIERIEKTESALRETLIRMVKEMQYQELLLLLDAIPKEDS